MADDTKNPFSISDMMQQGFEQSRKAMENYMDLFQKNMKASAWFASSDLSKQMQGCMEKNLAAASDFTQKLSQAKDFSEFLRIQSEFVGSQWKAFAEQRKEVGKTIKKRKGGAKEFLTYYLPILGRPVVGALTRLKPTGVAPTQ